MLKNVNSFTSGVIKKIRNEAVDDFIDKKGIATGRAAEKLSRNLGYNF